MNKLLFIAASLISSMFVTQQASAFCAGYDRTVSIPSAQAGRLTVIARTGTGVGARTAAFSVNPNDSASCVETTIQQGPHIQQCLKLWGTSGDDFIAFLNTQSTSYCGRTLYPVSFWGGILDVESGFGNDLVLGGSGDTLVNGGSGNDVVYSSTYPGSSASGGYGDDRIDGSGNTSARAYGGDGNDRVCAALTNANASISTMQGNAGTDKRCGSATNMSGFESTDCSACTLF
jgi:Ca2+-binding RTX toxin-like protein